MENSDALELLKAVREVEKNLSAQIASVQVSIAGTAADHAARIGELERQQRVEGWRQWMRSTIVGAVSVGISIFRGH